jgi:CRISPR-associated protein Csd1
LDLVERADPEHVKKLLSFDPRQSPDENRFYMVAVSGNGGRLRVHHWADLALTHVKQNLKNWHEQLRVEFPWDEPAPVRLWQLLYALDREGKPDDHTVLALLRRALEGLPLGYSVLSTALTGLRHPGGKDTKEKAGDKKSDPMSLTRLRVPMGLIRMCINDLCRQQEGAKEMSEGLDPGCTIPAYICGRLMAEFENLQRSSSEGDVNSSVLDRYFALASTYPSVAFPKIESLGQKHLRKLRRDNPPAAYAIDSRLQELHSLLQPSPGGAYPGKLGLEGQGLFSLGYYHQKARSRSQAQDRKQANAAIIESSNEINEESK